MPSEDAEATAGLWDGCPGYSHHWTVLVGKHNSLRSRTVHFVSLRGPSHRLWTFQTCLKNGKPHQSLSALSVCNLSPHKPSMFYLFFPLSQKGIIKQFWGLRWLKVHLFLKFSACNQQRILLCNHLLRKGGWAFGCHMAELHNYRICYGLMDEVIKSIVISTSLLLWTAVWCHIFLAVNYICAHTQNTAF